MFSRGGVGHDYWLDAVPDEILLNVFAYLDDAVSLCHVTCVCKRQVTLFFFSILTKLY